MLGESIGSISKLVPGGYVSLPNIAPGGKDIQQSFQLKDVTGLSHLTVELLDANNYSVYDTTIHYTTPQSATILHAIGVRTKQNDTSTNSGGIRVIFDRKDASTRYKLTYGTDGLTQQTSSTLGNFIDIPKLAFGTKYQVALIGTNGAGEGPKGEVKEVVVGTGYASPLIYYVEPADHGFFCWLHNRAR